MTVREFIEKLLKFNTNNQIIFEDKEGEEWDILIGEYSRGIFITLDKEADKV